MTGFGVEPEIQTSNAELERKSVYVAQLYVAEILHQFVSSGAINANNVIAFAFGTNELSPG